MLLNLAANARDAMPDGGVLSIEVEPGGHGARGRRPAAPEARSVVMAVSDTGQGMSEDVRARIFEPFFTTKSVGSGTGLGLAMVYGAVEQNGGSIEVVSAPGRGASFRILLPEARGEKAAAPPAQGEVPRGSETVLLVEDEAAVREVTRAQLESLGYRVLVVRERGGGAGRRGGSRRAAAPAAHRRGDARHERPRARRAARRSAAAVCACCSPRATART